MAVALAVLWPTVGSAATLVNVRQNRSEVGRHEKFELTLELAATYDNPFDPEQIDVTVAFQRPDGTSVVVPAFVYREYEVTDTTPERYVNPGREVWKARLAPDRLGEFTYAITATDADGTSVLDPAGSFTCVASRDRGIIRRNGRWFAHDDGSPRINIGHNVGWLSGGVATWREYFEAMGAAGENWTRIWMCPFGGDGGLILEYPAGWSDGYFHGAGRLSLQVAQRLDRVVELAEANGLAIQLVLQYHGAFSTQTNPNWEQNPYNTIHTGGFLGDPAEFFADEQARRLTRNKYRYIVARWGYSPAILAWELWNEVQFTDGWRNEPASVVAWHREMAEYLRDIDPHGHLITTSSHSSGFDELWVIPQIDLVQVHHYSGPAIPAFLGAAEQLRGYGKPVVMGEFGAGSVAGVDQAEVHPEDLPEPYRMQILDGLALHNGIWSAFHAGSSGHLWWWDSYIHARDLYDHFRPLAIYAAGEDLSRHELVPAPGVIPGAHAVGAVPGLGDFWAVSGQNEFTQTDAGFPGVEQLSRWLHGSSKATYRSDPVFHVQMETDGFLIIHVVQVSNWGTNRLRVRVDGTEVFLSTYPNGASDFEVRIPLAAGAQTVQVENAGNDWFQISRYEFAPQEEAILDSIGLIGPERGYFWIYDKGSQLGREPHGLLHGQSIRVEGLAPGTYDVHTYATRGEGGVIQRGRVVFAEGVFEYTLPDFQRDIAVKILPSRPVDLDDLLTVADEWLSGGSYAHADLTSDRNVDWADLARLAAHWLVLCPVDWPSTLR